jgi:hypothetical protein
MRDQLAFFVCGEMTPVRIEAENERLYVAPLIFNLDGIIWYATVFEFGILVQRKSYIVCAPPSLDGDDLDLELDAYEFHGLQAVLSIQQRECLVAQLLHNDLVSEAIDLDVSAETYELVVRQVRERSACRMDWQDFAPRFARLIGGMRFGRRRAVTRLFLLRAGGRNAGLVVDRH